MIFSGMFALVVMFGQPETSQFGALKKVSMDYFIRVLQNKWPVPEHYPEDKTWERPSKVRAKKIIIRRLEILGDFAMAEGEIYGKMEDSEFTTQRIGWEWVNGSWKLMELLPYWEGQYIYGLGWYQNVEIGILNKSIRPPINGPMQKSTKKN